MSPDVFNAETFFAGEWVFLREIRDLRLGLDGSLLGRAVIRPKESGDVPLYAYRESGQIRLGDYSGEAERCYLYRFPGEILVEVLFEDGRFFHELSIKRQRASAEHRCGEDLYETAFSLQSAYSWRSIWRVTGPRKDLLLTTHYLKMVASCPDCGLFAGPFPG